MLDYNEITGGKIITFENEPYEVLSHHVFRKQQRKPVNQTKLRNLKSGKVVEHSFHMSESVYEADMVKKPVTYIYKEKSNYWFHEAGNPSKRFTLSELQAKCYSEFFDVIYSLPLGVHSKSTCFFIFP